jgi:serine phosphatase RsbU (regulator of sigma subunit)
MTPGRASAAAPSAAVADAALALHDPGLTSDEVRAALERLVVDAGLARDAVFVPAGPRRSETTALADRPGADLVVEVRHGAAFTSEGGELRGTLHCWGTRTKDARLVESLAAHAGVALAVIAVRQVAELTHETLFPPIPAVANTAIDCRFRTAWRDAGVGGDFYDVFPLPTDCVLIVVGDVVGKGVKAARHVARITYTLRALALEGLALETIIERLDEHVTYQDPGIMATLWLGLYEPSSGELRFASLGHPPALLLRGRDAEAVRLELYGLPLGMRDLSPERPECRSRLLEPRDLLVVYTDGVVEGSGDFLAGQEALLQAVAARRDDPLADLADAALNELLADSGHPDDAIMLLLRRR